MTARMCILIFSLEAELSMTWRRIQVSCILKGKFFTNIYENSKSPFRKKKKKFNFGLTIEPQSFKKSEKLIAKICPHHKLKKNLFTLLNFITDSILHSKVLDYKVRVTRRLVFEFVTSRWTHRLARTDQSMCVAGQIREDNRELTVA